MLGQENIEEIYNKAYLLILPQEGGKLGLAWGITFDICVAEMWCCWVKENGLSGKDYEPTDPMMPYVRTDDTKDHTIYRALLEGAGYIIKMLRGFKKKKNGSMEKTEMEKLRDGFLSTYSYNMLKKTDEHWEKTTRRTRDKILRIARIWLGLKTEQEVAKYLNSIRHGGLDPDSWLHTRSYSGHLLWFFDDVRDAMMAEHLDSSFFKIYIP